MSRVVASLERQPQRGSEPLRVAKGYHYAMFIRFRQMKAERHGDGERLCAGMCKDRPRYYARYGAGVFVKGRTFLEGYPMKPICPLARPRERLEVSLARPPPRQSTPSPTSRPRMSRRTGSRPPSSFLSYWSVAVGGERWSLLHSVSTRSLAIFQLGLRSGSFTAASTTNH
jgi:hypothetical protein